MERMANLEDVHNHDNYERTTRNKPIQILDIIHKHLALVCIGDHSESPWKQDTVPSFYPSVLNFNES